MPEKSYAAFFDLDYTVLSINSGPVLVKAAYKAGLMNNANLLKAIYLSWMYHFHLKDTAVIISGMGKWLKGLKLQDVSDLAEIVVNQHLLKSVRPVILSEISRHKSNQADIVILSSVFEQVCKPLSQGIGADNLICTNMEVINGKFSGLPSGRYCFDDEKRIRLLEYCKNNRLSQKSSWYYGDSIADLPALAAVGHPVCVSPDKKLAAIAKSKNWRII